MEQRRQQHNLQWYHETQSSMSGATPLEPQAATIRDRFLLWPGAFADEALNTALRLRNGVFSASLASYHVLFPDKVILSHSVTLSLYDRLSTALTVAQVTGVQYLCSHYAARLAPLHSSDASRESNIRLAQITQYARQLASQPMLICHKALQQLGNVGLSPVDIVTFSQIIGFVSYQARVVAGVAALAGRPTISVPSFPYSADAEGIAFTDRELAGQSRLPVVTVDEASAEQRQVLDHSPPQVHSESYYLLLAHDASALRERNGVFININAKDGGLPAQLKALATLAVSRINGSRYCAAAVAQDIQDAGLVNALFATLTQGLAKASNPASQAVIRVVADLTHTPEQFTSQSVQPLFSSGLNQAQALDVILTGAFYAWENRLRQTLGETTFSDSRGR
ncbi:MAG: peroxidase-related enzyme [Serratia symbiotica]|nr:peroxidase-related enzyme [Serratia symbiotica]